MVLSWQRTAVCADRGERLHLGKVLLRLLQNGAKTRRAEPTGFIDPDDHLCGIFVLVAPAPVRRAEPS
jgi:hypothetical protein